MLKVIKQLDCHCFAFVDYSFLHHVVYLHNDLVLPFILFLSRCCCIAVDGYLLLFVI